MTIAEFKKIIQKKIKVKDKSKDKPKALPYQSKDVQAVWDEFEIFQKSHPLMLSLLYNEDFNKFKKYLHGEDLLQVFTVHYIKCYHPSVQIHHSVNEGKRTNTQQAKIQLMGMQKGVTDIQLRMKGKPILWIELKRQKNTITKEQATQILKCEAMGDICEICYTLNQIKNCVEKWMN